MLKTMKKPKVAILLLTSLFAGSASAVVPTEVTTLITGLSADFTALTAELWPLIAVVMGFFILVKWVKRGGSKL